MQNGSKTKGAAVFGLFLFVVVAGIAATVLLANDKRNLRILLSRFDIAVPYTTMTIPKPGRMTSFKRQPIEGKKVVLDPFVLAPEIKGYTSGMMRTVLKSGATICDLFASSGFAMSKWAPSLFNKQVHECFIEQIFPNPENPDDPASFFLMVKGTPSGALTSSRLKITFSSEEGRKQVVTLAVKAAKVFGEATGWRELIEQSGQIERLEPFALSRFGMNIRFSAEFGGSGRYNLVVNMAAKGAEAIRTAKFFRRENFMPLLPEIAKGGDDRQSAKRAN